LLDSLLQEKKMLDVHSELKSISMDKDEKKFYNILRQEAMQRVLAEMRKAEPVFNSLYREIHYSGSHFDNLKVKNRQEIDVNIILATPDDLTMTKRDPQICHFMEFQTRSAKYSTLLNEDDCISAQKMFQMVNRAGDRAITNLGGTQVFNNVQVKVTRSVSNPYTVRLEPLRGNFRTVMEIDMVPALQIPVSILPRDVQTRVNYIANKVGVQHEDQCLAVALPVVRKDALQIDFPQLARKMMENKQAIKGAIRLLKHERDTKGGTLLKIWSYVYKNVGLLEIIESPGQNWSERNLEQIHARLRARLGEALHTQNLEDFVFTSLNLMKRIKRDNVKNDAYRYLNRNNRAESRTKCSACNKLFVDEAAKDQHFSAAHISRDRIMASNQNAVHAVQPTSDGNPEESAGSCNLM